MNITSKNQSGGITAGNINHSNISQTQKNEKKNYIKEITIGVLVAVVGGLILHSLIGF